MSDLQYALANDYVNFIIGQAASNRISEAAAERRLHLYTVKPARDGTGGTEVTGGSYAATRCDNAYTSGASNGAKSNDSAIVFPEATASWGTIVAYGIADASGNLLCVDDLAASVAVDSGDTFYFPAGDLTITG